MLTTATTATTATTPLAVLIGGDAPTHAMLRFLLEDDGCAVAEFTTAGAALAAPDVRNAVLLILIAGEPQGQGDALAALTTLRRAGWAQPAVLLARARQSTLRPRALALGVQEVIGLPADARDLQARLRSALRQQALSDTPRGEGTVTRAGGLTLRGASREVGDATGWRVPLTRREAALLQALMRTPGQVVSYQALLAEIWGAQGWGTHNSLAVYVRRVRAKLTRPAAPQGYLHTVHGQGYLFEARAAPRPSGAATPAPATPDVLVVDDDRATVTVMIDVLQRAGYTVACTSGAQAPTLARQTPPRAIFLDINMPEMDGIAVRRQLRASPRTAHIPVIALSASGNLRRRAEEMEADDYLAKPFTMDELLLRVEKWVGRPQLAVSSS